MKVCMVLAGAFAVLAPAAGAEAAETRCGWLLNPTPANFYLLDAQGSWGIMSQGSIETNAAGIDEHLPAFDEGEYVQTQPNGYGYGCACLAVDADAAKERITRLYSGRIPSLSKCRRDPALPSPD